MKRLLPLAGLCLCLLAACSAPTAPVATPAPTPTTVPAPTPTESTPVPTASPEPEGILPDDLDVPLGVKAAAVGFVQDELDLWNDPEGSYSDRCLPGSFDNWRVSNLESAYEYRDLEGYDAIAVYRLDYWLHTTAPEAVALAGGMDLTEDGWLLPTYRNCTYLYFTGSGDWPLHLFTQMENDCQPGDELFTQDLVNALQNYVAYPETAFQPDGWPHRFGLGSIRPCPLGAPSSVDIREFPYAPDQAEVHVETYDGVTLTRVVSTGADTGGIIALTVTRPDWPMVNGTRVGDTKQAVAAAWPGLSDGGDVCTYDPTPDEPSPYYLDFTFRDDILTEITCREILDH